MKVYKHMHTKEVVEKDNAEDYAMDQLGITITPKGKDGTLTLEQTEFISEFTEWYFSDNWIEEDVKEDL